MVSQSVSHSASQSVIKSVSRSVSQSVTDVNDIILVLLFLVSKWNVLNPQNATWLEAKILIMSNDTVLKQETMKITDIAVNNGTGDKV